MFSFQKNREKRLLTRSLSLTEQKSGTLLVGFREPIPDAHLVHIQSIGADEIKKISANIAKIKLNPQEDMEDAILRLQDRTDVKYVEPDYLCSMYQNVSPDPLEPVQWWLKTARFETAWVFTEGEGSLVAVLDTGVDNTHPDLQGQIVNGWNFIDNNADTMDKNGHGTHITGTIVALTNNGIGGGSASPKSKVLAVKVLNDKGLGSYSALIQGIIYAADNQARVISLSLGSSNKSFALQEAINYAKSKSVIVVAAAGNDNVSTLHYPGSYSDLCVGAIDQSTEKAWFSNFGNWVDVVAPGVSIVSTFLDEKYESMDGTSMATPQVAAQVALLCAKMGKNALSLDIVDRIIKSSRSLPWMTLNGSKGGLIDATKALSLLDSVPKPLKFNAGGGTIGDFLSDNGMCDGRAYMEHYANPIPVDIEGVKNPAPNNVYLSERVGVSKIALKIVNGYYIIRLHFCEIFFNDPNKRQFNIKINGQIVQDNFDIFATTGARNKAIVLEFEGEVEDETLTISFEKIPNMDCPKISGYEIYATE